MAQNFVSGDGKTTPDKDVLLLYVSQLKANISALEGGQAKLTTYLEVMKVQLKEMEEKLRKTESGV